MSPAIHHVSIVTSEADRLAAFLTEVLALPPLAGFEVGRAEVGDLLGWAAPGPDDPETIPARLFGSGPAGLVEVVELSGASAPAPAAGLVQLAVQVPDLGEVLERARPVADAVVEPRSITVAGQPVTVAAVVVAGVRFQLTESRS